MLQAASRLGSRLGGWNDRRSSHDCRRDATRLYRAVDRIAGWLYVLPDRRWAATSWLFAIYALAVFFLFLLLEPSAWAQDAVPGAGDPVPVTDGPSTSAVNLVLVVLGGLTPLLGYLLNWALPQTTEQVKGLVQAVLAAGVAVVYTSIQSNGLELDTELLLSVLTAMASALFAHLGFKTAGWNTFLGGGLNRQAGDRLFQRA